MQTNLLSIEDLKGCAYFAIRREGRLNTKQIRVLARKANDNIGSQFFWDWFVAKYGVPIPNSRGFAAGKDAFAFYYFEAKKAERSAKKLCEQYDSRTKNTFGIDTNECDSFAK